MSSWRTAGRPGGATADAAPAPAELEVLAVADDSDPRVLQRPCVDCGRRTGRFCDYCRAADRFPAGDATGRGWAEGQLTPLCSACDNSRDACHYCLDIWVTRPVDVYRFEAAGGSDRGAPPEEEAAAGGAGGS